MCNVVREGLRRGRVGDEGVSDGLRVGAGRVQGDGGGREGAQGIGAFLGEVILQGIEDLRIFRMASCLLRFSARLTTTQELPGSYLVGFELFAGLALDPLPDDALFVCALVGQRKLPQHLERLLVALEGRHGAARVFVREPRVDLGPVGGLGALLAGFGGREEILRGEVVHGEPEERHVLSIVATINNFWRPCM